MSQVLVTGGAGFIGSHLAETLLAQGRRVIAVDNLSTGRLENIAGLMERPEFQFVYESIHNEAVMDRLVSECDMIYHLAAVVGVELIIKDPVHTIETNLNGTETVLRLARRYRRKVLDRFHVRGVRQERRDPVPRGRRPGDGADDQEPLELCRVQGDGRIPGAWPITSNLACRW